MKRVVLSVFIMVVLVWSCSVAFCRGGARGGGGQRGSAIRQGRAMPRQGGERTRTWERTREREKARERKKAQEREKVQEREKAQERERTQKRERTRERIKDKTFSEGKGRQRQMRAFERQMRQDEAKHRWRLARLKRIRRLAAKAENSEVTKQVEKLMIMERDRYERRLGKISQKMERILRAIEEDGD